MSDTRSRLVAATAELLREGGYHGTGLKDVTDAAAATTGSLYHHFPGGKQDLVAAAIADTGAAYRQLFELIADAASSPAGAIGDFFDGAAETLEQTDYLDICPVATIAGEIASTNDVLRTAAAAVFAGWTDAVAARLGSGRSGARARVRLARTIIAAFEGGLILARSSRDASILRDIGADMQRLVRAQQTAATRRS